MKDPSSSSAAAPERQPLPTPSPLTEGFWDAAREHRLVVQRCDDCGQNRHYPQHLCPACQSPNWSWVPVSGKGRIYSYTVTHQPFGAYWATRLPFVVATIELEEGVRMMSDLPGEDTDDVAIDASVEVFFDDLPDITLPRFRLVRS